jgi:glycosyltransferase involved in cell wall biosynthesis
VKVLVVNNMAPFVSGGAEALADHLQRNLAIAGHQAEVLRIPFRWEPATRIPSQMLMVRALEIANVDRVIALKFPAYLIRHPHKTLWLVHQFRQAYDLYDAGLSNIPATAQGQEIRRVVSRADDESFRESRRIFTNSEITRDRLARYSGFEAEVLRPPLNDPELFKGGVSHGYVFAGGRVNATKRQGLILEALALAPPRVRLVIAGPPDTAADATALERRVEELGLAGRVRLDLRFLPRPEIADYVNHAVAVACLPYDEDSLSYLAMEASAAGKALISTSDSGGVLGLAKHRRTGWVAEPEPASLAEGLARVGLDTPSTRELGQAARALWVGMGITWPRTVERLLA